MFCLTPKSVFCHQMQSKRHLKSELHRVTGVTCLGGSEKEYLRNIFMQDITFEYLKNESDSNRQLVRGSCRLGAHQEHAGRKNKET